MPSRRDLAGVLCTWAREDLVALRRFGKDEQLADSILGFHAQQGVEKAKAVLAHADVAFERTHDLNYLVELLDAEGLAPPVQTVELVELTGYAVGFRYDDPVEEEASLDRARALKSVERVVDWAEETLA